METEYIDFLLVKKQDESLALVIAESHKADVGHIIEFNGGDLGRVVMVAWASERNGELHNLITAIVPTYEADAVYWQSWKREADNAVS